MTRNELMEEVYKKDRFCSAGDITLAVAKRFPRWQGNYYHMAAEFLRKKQAAYYKEKAAFSEFMAEANLFVRALAWDMHREKVEWELPGKVKKKQKQYAY